MLLSTVKVILSNRKGIMRTFENGLADYLLNYVNGRGNFIWNPRELVCIGPHLFAVNDGREWDVFFDPSLWVLNRTFTNPEPETEAELREKFGVGFIPSSTGLWDCKTLQEVVTLVRKSILALGDAYQPCTLKPVPIDENSLKELANGSLERAFWSWDGPIHF